MKRITALLGLLLLGVTGVYAADAAATGTATAGTGTAATPAAKTPINEADLTFGTAATNNDTTGASAGGVGIWSLIQMLFVLALVVVSIYGVVWLIRRNRKKQEVQETELISLLGSQGLPGSRWLHLVAVQKQVFLIGSSDQSVNLIAEIADQEAKDELRILASKDQKPQKLHFADILGNVFGQPKPGPKKDGKNFTFLQSQKQRAKKLGE